ncbi:MAG: hypothetical protein IPI67_40140 [Myxococcales bacterium]|nr:hypothetical protein [Myxococcales bacterium]
MRVAVITLALTLVGCSGPTDPTLDLRTPPRETFDPPSGMLEARCGSLDCHGQVGRSLLIYSKYGLRLEPSDRPGGDKLSDAGSRESERDQNYLSVVAIEPELLDRVVRDSGAHPERLTLVRKARGAEAHKGNAPSREGSDADRCLLAWLSGNVEEQLCVSAAQQLPPPAW